MKLAKLLQETSQKLSSITDSPRLEAECLLSHALSITRSEIYAYPEMELSEIQLKSFPLLMERRIQGEPLAYILGLKEFWSLGFKVTPATLIPRPETESLVEWMLVNFPNDQTLKIADLGTGSGAIALSLASERPHWKITATDQSSEALDIARYNAKKLGILNVELLESDWCEALKENQYFAIVSNPPYIEPNDPHLTQLQWEPKSALVAGENGLSDLRSIIETAHHYLSKNGYLVLEHAFDQSQPVQSLLRQNGYKSIESHPDLNDHLRFTTASKIGF